MKIILLKEIHMINFMGEKDRTTTFNLKETIIQGANGLGKSRHFDAFLWLLFGKDAAGRKDYEIRTRINGELLHEVECSVTGEIVVDGDIITLKRSYVEDWVKPQAKSERILKGNHTDCWWNGVPIKIGEYDKRIAEIVDATLFRMITDPKFFPALNWKDQRQSLFNLAGDIDDDKIISERPEFQKLMDTISGKSLSDYKSELSSTKKRLNLELSQIQPRIDQTQHLMPESSDFDAIEKRIAEIDAEIEVVDKSIADASAGERAKFETERKLQSEINDIRRKMDIVVNDAKNKNIEVARKTNAEFDEWNNELRELHSKLSSNSIQINRHKNEQQLLVDQINMNNTRINELKTRVEECRTNWKAENTRKFDGDKCPNCGQILPPEMLENAEKSFHERQKNLKDSICADSEVFKLQIEAIQKTVSELESTINVNPDAILKLSQENLETQSRIDTLTNCITNTAKATPAEVIPENIAEWRELNSDVELLEKKITLAKEQNPGDITTIATRKSELNTERKQLINTLANRNIIERSVNEIHDLEENAKNLAQQIAELEQKEFVMQEFGKRRVEEMERMVNSMFSLVTWKLFDYTLDGNPVETCTALIDGVPYARANTASCINAGLDIINALCAKYDVVAPIFLDNAEGVNQYLKTAGQVIKLVVTTDNCIIIKN